MPLPNTPTWNLADFSGPTLGGLLSLGTGDLTITPSTYPYFTYNDGYTILTARSADGILAMLDFNSPIPSRYTIEMTVRFPEMPHNFSDLEDCRAGVTVADDAGRGISIYFSTSGVAVSRVDDFGSVTALPETNDTTAEVAVGFKTIRVAVDSGLGRAYVMIGDSDGVTPEVRYILPIEESTGTDLFRVFTKGLPTQPVRVEIKALRLASGVLIPDIPPTADAGPDRVAPVGQAIRFDGRGSFDIEGAPLTYQWLAIDAPFGSAYAAENSSGSTIDDGDADGFTDLLSFSMLSLPAWVAPGDVLRIGSDRHTIATVDNSSGTLTTESRTIPDNLSSTPFRIIDQSMLVGSDTETPYLVPDVQGIYRVSLTVNDGESSSEASEVLASIVGARSPLGVEPDVSVLWKALGDEWNTIDKKEVFEEAWRGVAQILSGKLLEVWQHHYNLSLRDAQRTFQRKWVAFKTLIVETSPTTATVSPRYGSLFAEHHFEYGAPSVSGQELEVVIMQGAAEVSTSVTLTGNSLSQIISDVNTALAGTGISAYAYGIRSDSTAYRFGFAGSTVDDGDGDGFTATVSFTPGGLPSWVGPGDTVLYGSTRAIISSANIPGGNLLLTAEEMPDNVGAGTFVIYRTCRLAFRGSRGFRIAGAAATGLGIPGGFNYLQGLEGAAATDRTYYVSGMDFGQTGLTRGDLLVLNNGQSFTVDRFLSAEDDPLPNQRILLSDPLPLDASAEWGVPSLVVSTAIDYELEGVYPGDLIKFEVYDTSNGVTLDASGYVVAQKEKKVAGQLEALYGFLEDARYELRLLGIKRRKSIPIDEDIVSIPRLQEIIPKELDPFLWKENEHYVLEPFYRDLNGSPIPQIQFRDEVFIEPNLEPPDVLWAELVVLSNDKNIENLFGVLAGFRRDDASTFGRDFNYSSGVAGLMYAQQRGPSVAAVQVGAQILLGQPFAEVEGIIEEVRNDFSPATGRLLVRDGTDGTSEILRTYYYRKDPLDLSSSSGLALYRDLNRPIAVGDTLAQFAPIGAGVNIVDMYNDPKWFIPYVKSGIMGEIEKFHKFLVRFNLDLVSLANLSILYSFITRVKPTYTHPSLVGLRQVADDIDPVDELALKATMKLYDSPCGAPQAYMYDDYRGDGTIWSSMDDGSTFFDGITDCPVDVISFILTMTWAGGVITYDSLFFEDTVVTDVSGAHTGIPGSTFVPTYDMNLPAGTYSVTVTIKGGGIVLP
jgi:hypothetical protein